MMEKNSTEGVSADSTPVIEISTLGGFRAAWPSGAPLHIRSKKARALLACLVTAPQMRQSREYLAALLWEDSDGSHSRASLRQAIANLRRSLKDDDQTYVLTGDREMLALRPEHFRLDLSALSNGAAPPTHGEFLLDLAGLSEPFEDWRRAEAARLETMIEGLPPAQHAIAVAARAAPVGPSGGPVGDKVYWAAAAAVVVIAVGATFMALKPATRTDDAESAQAAGSPDDAAMESRPLLRWQLEPQWRRKTAEEHPELKQAIEDCRSEQPESARIIAACTRLVDALDNSNPLRSSALVNRATAHRWNGDYAESNRDLETAFAADPSHYNALHGMAYNYYLMGDYQHALDLYARVREMQPKHFMAVYRTGETYFALGEYQKAVEAYTAAIENNRDSALAFLWRGRAYAELGEVEAAKRDYMQAATMNGEVRQQAEAAFAALPKAEVVAEGGDENAQ